MTSPNPANRDDPSARFAQEAEGHSPGLVREIFDLLRYNKKWWLIPLVVVLLAAGLFVVLSGTVFAPFIYTMF